MVSRHTRLQRRRTRRTFRVRNAIRRNSTSQYRLSVFRSGRNIYAQIIDDEAGHTVCSASSLQQGQVEGSGGNVSAAEQVGRKIAELALAQDVTTVTFDRGPYQYHGRIAALADAAREAGLNL